MMPTIHMQSEQSAVGQLQKKSLRNGYGAREPAKNPDLHSDVVLMIYRRWNVRKSCLTPFTNRKVNCYRISASELGRVFEDAAAMCLPLHSIQGSDKLAYLSTKRAPMVPRSQWDVTQPFHSGSTHSWSAPNTHTANWISEQENG